MEANVIEKKVNIVEKIEAKHLEIQKRHQKILDAAIRLFSERGYAGTSTAKLAKYAEVKEATIYTHFANKRDLFVKCLEFISSQFLEILQKERNARPDDELGYLQASIGTSVTFVKNHPHQSRLLGQLQYYRIDPEFDAFYKESNEEVIEEIEQVLKSLKKKGVLKSAVNTRTLAAIFNSQFSTIFYLNEFTDPEHLTFEMVFQQAKNVLEID